MSPRNTPSLFTTAAGSNFLKTFFVFRKLLTESFRFSVPAPSPTKQGFNTLTPPRFSRSVQAKGPAGQSGQMKERPSDWWSDDEAPAEEERRKGHSLFEGPHGYSGFVFKLIFAWRVSFDRK